MKKWLLLFLLTALTAYGCNNRIPDDFDYGAIESGVYHNDYFLLKVPIMEGWHVLSPDEVKHFMDEGEKRTLERNGGDEREVKASRVSTATLLGVFRYPRDSAVSTFNESVLIMVENLKGQLFIKNATDYLDQIKKGLQSRGSKFRVAPDYTKRKMGQRNFDVLRATSNPGTAEEVTQLYCCTLEKRFALIIVFTFAGDEQEEEMDRYIKTIQME